MNIKKYSEEIKRTLAELDNIDNEYHMILGMLTELGELADIYKRNLAYGKEVDVVNVVEEIGDLFWYLVNLCNILGFDVEKILDINVEKLYKRYKITFTTKEAINRILDEERDLLESMSNE